ncbi:MAG: hypothetical protein IJX76_05030 [Clostridia bacterium]|nr:hypothetical protein [Clostridia bacterium]
MKIRKTKRNVSVAIWASLIIAAASSLLCVWCYVERLYALCGVFLGCSLFFLAGYFSFVSIYEESFGSFCEDPD